ncbi:MAG: ABC transporter substrate-binding protein [Syntrophales bacterium]|nr:ABC transporter substrate-binding protein [Syntrophales bacterium]MDY0044351.1 ABC transporter substrate-binding protein [Syntrophales bacterium]
MRIKMLVTCAIIFAVIGVAFGFAGTVQADQKASVKGPIVMVYVADMASPAGSLVFSWLKVAAEQINESGGILGQKMKVIAEDCKGQPNLAVEAYTRALTNHNATIVSIYPRSEIVLACEAKAGEMYPDYPHILLAIGSASDEITYRIVEQYDKWKFVFRDQITVSARVPIYRDQIDFFHTLGVKKFALLREDLTWTESIFNAFPATKYHPAILSVPDYAKTLGMEVVYQKALKYRAGMYSPIFEAITASGAEGIIFIASDGNDTDVVVRQWYDSSARDLHMLLTGATGARFWERTGGKVIGVIVGAGEIMPLLSGKYTPEVPDVMETAEKYGLQLASPVLYSGYPDMFLIKKALIKAGGADDINAVIKALEETEIMGPQGLLKFETTRIPPFFHGAVFCDINDPTKYAAQGIRSALGQVQENGKIVFIQKPFEGVDGSIDYYKSVSELRKTLK